MGCALTKDGHPRPSWQQEQRCGGEELQDGREARSPEEMVPDILGEVDRGVTLHLEV